MTPSKRSTRSIVTVLLLTLLALALTACKPLSTKPSTAPTKPLAVNCDRTPPPAAVPFVPELKGEADIPANDAWKAQMIGLYQVEVTIRRDEHVCMDTLRAKGVIQ
jgi:hypothetical protein